MRQTLTTTVAVAGGGPAGAMLALLLARAGVPVTVVEAHRDLDRDFRGDMIHPSTLEVLDQLGLAERLHALPHAKARHLRFVAGTQSADLVDFSRLPTRFPYVMVMPQVRFLDFLVAEARRFEGFRLLTGAAVAGLLDERGAVSGVSCAGPAFHGEVRALLTVGADGRASKVRRLAGLRATPQSRPMEVIWCRVPRVAADPVERLELHLAAGRVVVLIGRENDWQIGCVVPPGRYAALKASGADALRSLVGDVVPWLDGRLASATVGLEVSVLRIQADRVETWHRSGLLVIGDAAHVMLPVGGVGINCAVADAVETANALVPHLRTGQVPWSALADVQRRRAGLTAIIQRFQRVQHRVLDRALRSAGPCSLPWPLVAVPRVPGLRALPGRMIGYGLRPARVDASLVRLH